MCRHLEACRLGACDVRRLPVHLEPGESGQELGPGLGVEELVEGPVDVDAADARLPQMAEIGLEHLRRAQPLLVRLDLHGDGEPLRLRLAHDGREAYVLGRAPPPPRAHDLVDSRGTDLLHLRAKRLAIGARVDAASGVVRRGEILRRQVLALVPVEVLAVDLRRAPPRVEEDRRLPRGARERRREHECGERYDKNTHGLDSALATPPPSTGWTSRGRATERPTSPARTPPPCRPRRV